MAGNINNAMVIRSELTAGIATYAFTATRGFEVVDGLVQVDTQVGGTTVILNRAAAACVTAAGAGAFDMNVAPNTVIRAVDIVDAQATFVTGDVHNVVQAGAAGTGDFFTYVVPTTWIAG
jgi:hypothetical protein